MNMAESSVAQNATFQDSTAIRRAPKISRNTLTIMLALMCTVPGVTILALWYLMPPVSEGTLEVDVTRVGVPEIEYYLIDISERADVSEAAIIIKNVSDQEWTHTNIQVNKHYQVYDLDPIPPGAEREYLLNRFLSRTGARFDLRQLPLRHIRLYARQADKGDRATLDIDYPDMVVKR